MGQENLQHELGRATHLAARVREREEQDAYDLHMRSVKMITAIFFVVGSLLVLLFTKRPALIGLVAMICTFGYIINLINKPVDSE